jgi:hypothetical protein
MMTHPWFAALLQQVLAPLPSIPCMPSYQPIKSCLLTHVVSRFSDDGLKDMMLGVMSALMTDEQDSIRVVAVQSALSFISSLAPSAIPQHVLPILHSAVKVPLINIAFVFSPISDVLYFLLGPQLACSRCCC